MPTAGHRGVLDALRGSTTERVIRHAPCQRAALIRFSGGTRAWRKRKSSIKQKLITIDVICASKARLIFAEGLPPGGQKSLRIAWAVPLANFICKIEAHIF
jgi:hypothetical protein